MPTVTTQKENREISIRILSNETFLKQILKLLSIIKTLINSMNEKSPETVITVKISNKNGIKMLMSVNDEILPDMYCLNKEITIGR